MQQKFELRCRMFTLIRNKPGNGIDGGYHLSGLVLIGDPDSIGPLDGHNDLNCIDRIECERIISSEKRFIVIHIIGVHIFDGQSVHDQFFYFKL